MITIDRIDLERFEKDMKHLNVLRDTYIITMDEYRETKLKVINKLRAKYKLEELKECEENGKNQS